MWIYCMIILFYTICLAKIFNKANCPWWGAFIPIYNIYLLFKITLGNEWLFLLLFIPIIGQIIILIVTYTLGKVFDRSGILMIFFSFIIIPTIAFSEKYYYQGQIA